MIFAGIYIRLFQMINNAGKLDCCYNAFEKPGTEAIGSSTFPCTLNKPIQHLAE